MVGLTKVARRKCRIKRKAVLYSASNVRSSAPRVVVTGVGIVTALGLGYRSNAAGFRAGRTAFRPISLFDVSRQRVKHAAEMDLPSETPGPRLSRRQMGRLDRATRLLLHAAAEALGQAGWSPAEPVPMVLGTTSGGMSHGEAYYRQATRPPYPRRGQATRVLQYLVQTQSRQLADAFGLAGPATVISNACASGANAIGHAWDCLRRAKPNASSPAATTPSATWSSPASIRSRRSRPRTAAPLTRHRDGLGPGRRRGRLRSGNPGHARQRRAEILGEIVGYGAATDPHHLTQPHPQGEAALANP